MAVNVDSYVELIPALEQAPGDAVWVSYDREADVLYVNYRMPAVADGGEEIEPGVIARYDDAGELIGYTITNASHKMRSRPDSDDEDGRD